MLVAFAGFGFGFGEKRTHSRTRIDHVIDPIYNEHQLIRFAMNCAYPISKHIKKNDNQKGSKKKTHTPSVSCDPPPSAHSGMAATPTPMPASELKMSKN